MKSILERALVHILNEEKEQAEELLHQFVIETARGIHETLREGDEVELEAELEEEFFTEGDLDDVDGAEDAAVDLGDDLGEEVPAEADAGEMTDDTLDGEGEVSADDMGGDIAPEGDIESEIENFEQELADLQAKFDAMLAEIEGEDDVADEGDLGGEDDFGGDDMGGDDMGGDDLGGDDMGGEEDMGGDDELSQDDLVKESVEEDEFDDITESVVDELQKVAAETAEGKTTNGENHLGNKTSLKFNKPEASATKAQSTKRVGHTGFARETAPSSEALRGSKTVVSTKMRNVRNDAEAGNHKVTPTSEGPRAKIRAKAPDAAHAKGPISGKPVGKK